MNYAHILNGVVRATSSAPQDGYIECPAEVECGWSYDGKNWSPMPPKTVTKLQFVGQLINEGLLAQASTFINGNGIPEGPQREKAKAQWLWGNEVPRNGPVIIALLTHLGKDSAAIDEFFLNAAALSPV